MTMMDVSVVSGQVVLAPSTITQGVTLLVGTPASEFTISVVRTGLVTVDTPSMVNSSPTLPADIIPTPPASIVPTVFVTDSATGATTAIALNQAFSLPALPAVLTQAPCVSACLQEPLIASAAGSCAATAGTVVDNACACLSAPLVAIHALTNCASAACNGVAAGPSGLPADLVAVTSLYNDYCTSAVGAAALASAAASGQAVPGTAAAGSTTTVTAGTDTPSTTGSTDTTTPWLTDTSTNGTVTANATLATNGTFGGGATFTAGPSAIDPGITTGMASSMSSVGATTSGPATKSEACLELRHKHERAVLSLVVALMLPLLIL
ncbi:hypothetical protein NKR19_g8700 [Coniochaeta hoffmannii]|uniref:CFEM domain-containing protein n=1 Tax=Coniochaeta hoffmannii TaxID=91930 RepID=A0AA38R5J0_9PEZI|nr:hypothetical protein NKR19_g8700 [Coniochaeta hoffmannii]